jgi:ATP-binding cassette subfamily F protein uup
VSHDRSFLDNVVTSTLVFEGDGKFGEYAGGYEDWERYQRQIPEPPAQPQKRASTPTVQARRAIKQDGGPRKLTYKEHRELQELPARIEALEIEQAELHHAMGNADFYRQASEKITTTLERLESIKQELEEVYQRWQELESVGA